MTEIRHEQFLFCTVCLKASINKKIKKYKEKEYECISDSYVNRLQGMISAFEIILQMIEYREIELIQQTEKDKDNV